MVTRICLETTKILMGQLFSEPCAPHFMNFGWSKRGDRLVRWDKPGVKIRWKLFGIYILYILDTQSPYTKSEKAAPSKICHYGIIIIPIRLTCHPVHYICRYNIFDWSGLIPSTKMYNRNWNINKLINNRRMDMKCFSCIAMFGFRISY